MAYILIALIRSKADIACVQAMMDEAVKLKLIATVTSMEKHDKIHPTWVILGELLHEEFLQSCIILFLYNNVLKVEVDLAIIKRGIEYF